MEYLLIFNSIILVVNLVVTLLPYLGNIKIRNTKDDNFNPLEIPLSQFVPQKDKELKVNYTDKYDIN